MPVPDREMLFQAMAKLMERRAIVIPKPDPLFTEFIDFHSTIDDRVSIPRSRWGIADLDPSMPVLTEEILYSVYTTFREIGNPGSQFIGDQTCANNAKSSHLRCAVNPCGPCEGCLDYQPGVRGAGGAL